MSNQLYFERYKGVTIAFDRLNGHIYANATAMCHANNKHLPHWFRLPNIKNAIGDLEVGWHYPNPLIITRTGNDNDNSLVGIWIHERLIGKLAYWLGDEFAEWCGARIDSMKPQTHTATPDTRGFFEVDNMTLLAQNLFALSKGYLDTISRQSQPIEVTQPISQPVQKQKEPDAVQTDDVALSVTVIADELGLSAEQLNKRLEAAGVQRKVSGYWILTNKHKDKGYTVLRSYLNHDEAGKEYTVNSMKWTRKGRALIHWLFNPDVEAQLKAASELLES